MNNLNDRPIEGADQSKADFFKEKVAVRFQKRKDRLIKQCLLLEDRYRDHLNRGGDQITNMEEFSIWIQSVATIPQSGDR